MFDNAKTYIGTKLLKAAPCTRGDYNAFKGWEPPEGEDQTVDGYVVRYTDGYTSWTPKRQFEEAYVAVPETTAEGVLAAVRHKTAEIVG